MRQKKRSKSIFKRCLVLCWRFILGILGFVVGLSIALLLYEFVLSETDFDDAYKVIIFLSTAIFLSLGFAFSTQMICITLLTLPEFTSRAGRRSLQATILILVLAGPLRNLGENGEETLRFFGCIKDMLWEIFMAGVDLVLAPIQNIVADLKRSASVQEHDDNYNASMIKSYMEPILQEVEGTEEVRQMKAESDQVDDDMGSRAHRSDELEYRFRVVSTANESERIVAAYRKKLAYRCEEIFTKGTEVCIDLFRHKHTECSDYFGETLAWILCWPMKLEFICDILSDFSVDKTCKVDGIIDKNFGETYTFAKKGIDDFTQSFKFHVNYEGFTKIVNLDKLKSGRDELLEHFLESRKYVEWYLTMIKRSLSLSYILILHSALNYHKKYFTKLSFDNGYLSTYFRQIDTRRRQRSKMTLLPLKTFEKGEVSQVKRFKLTEAEAKKFANLVFALILQASIVFTIFALDHVFRELLQLLANHAEIQVKQEGIHVLAIQVKGEGFLAQLLRRVVSDFSVRKDLDITHFTKPCLPNPRTTPAKYYQRVILLFAVLLTNAYFEAHFVRFRHCIPDYFYPKRYKKRATWLYNEMLRRRRRKMTHLKRKVLENADRLRTYMPLNPLQLLVHWFPRQCACLKRWKDGRRKCILCLANGSIHHCPRCGFSYCAECFADVDQRCLHCDAEQELRHHELSDVTIPNDHRHEDEDITTEAAPNDDVV